MAVIKNISKNGQIKNSTTLLANYWQNKFGTNLNRCVACGCVNKGNLVPTLVQKNTSANNWYIIPLCETHSETNGELSVCNTTRFISENEFAYWAKTEAQRLMLANH